VTLLVDPALLYATGYGLGRWSQDQKAAAVGAAAVSGTVLGLSVTTYCDAPFMRPVWEALGARSGRDLILNSWGVLHFDPGRRSTRRRVIVAALFASYPVWAAIGVAAGRRRRNRDGGELDGGVTAPDDRPRLGVVADRRLDRRPADLRSG
jgi:hypothetical protein